MIRAKELEIDSITEKSQNLYTMSMSTKNSQITEIVQKFHQLSMEIKVNLFIDYKQISCNNFILRFHKCILLL